MAALPALGVPPLVQLPGTAGCVSEDGTGGSCADGVALTNLRFVVVSPDGSSVYTAAGAGDAIGVFDRDASTGVLTQKAGTDACVSETGTGGACADGVALDFPGSVAVSPDGRNVYLASRNEDAVAVFDRDPSTGVLTQKAGTDGCVSDTGTMGNCANGVALRIAASVAVSPDGRNVYVASRSSDAVAVFDRDLSTGALTQKAGTDACVSDDGTGGDCADGVALEAPESVAVSPDGRNVYVGAGGFSDAVAVFDRDPSTGVLTQKAGTDGCVSDDGTGGMCADGVALDNPASVVVSPNGRNVYVASSSSDAVVVFDRDLSTGVLTQKAGTDGCVSDTGTGGACTDGLELDVPNSVAVSPDGLSVYVAARFSDALAVFDRDASSGVLTQKAGLAACVSETGTGGACTDGVAVDEPYAVAVSPDGRSVYVASDDSHAVSAFARDVPAYDIDGDGEIEALIDGLLLLRYFFGFRDAALITGAVDLANCTRCTAAEIETFIAALEAEPNLAAFLVNGDACVSGGECLSGNCIDGFCCDTSCGDPCDGCNVAASEGTCTVVALGSPGSPSCSPYVCDGSMSSCPVSCGVNADCAAGFVCSAGVCEPAVGG